MDKLDFNKDNLRKFGVTMGIAFLVITLIIILRQRHSVLPTSIISLIFFASAFMVPVLLKPIYIFWMKLAFILSWFNTRLILCILFYLIFTPIGVGLKLFGVDLLDRKIDKNKVSYWKKKEGKVFSPSDYERQF